MTRARTLADMISDGVIGTTELADDVITPVKLDETGNYSMAQLGIGTSSPDYPLHVKGTSNILKLETSTNSRTQLGGYDASGNANFLIGSNDSTNTEFWSYKNGYMRFATNSTERMHITSAGNVGIGTGTPNEKLSVSGNIELYNDEQDGYIWFHDAGTRSWTLGSQQSSGNFVLTNTVNIGSNEKLVVTSAGNVGIGTSSPYSRLSIASGSGGNNTGMQIQRTDAGGAKYWIWPTATANGEGAGKLLFQDATSGSAVDVMAFSGGNVGIGTVSPPQRLTVASNSHGVSLDYVSALPSGAGMYTSSQAHTAQAYGDLNIKSRSDYAGYGVGVYTASSNNSPLLRLKVDASGRVTKPYQPVFKAYLTSDLAMTYGGYNKITHSATNINIGGHFNTSNSRFVAPVAGTYFFYASVIAEGFGATEAYRISLNIRKNGNTSSKDGLSSGGAANAVHDDNEAQVSGLIYLNANDYVEHWVNVNATDTSGNIWGASSSNAWTSFQGYLIG